MNLLPGTMLEGITSGLSFNEIANESANGRIQGYEIWIGGMRFPVSPSDIKIDIGGQSVVVKLADTSSISIQQMPDLNRYTMELWLPTVKTPQDWWIQTKASDVGSYFVQSTTSGSGQPTFKDPFGAHRLLPGEEGPELPFPPNVGQIIDLNYNQQEYIDHLEFLKGKLESFDFVILRAYDHKTNQFNTAQKVTLEDYFISQTASKSRHDVYVTVNLLQWKPAKVFKGYQTTDGQGNKTWEYNTETQEVIPEVPKFTAITADTDSLWKISQRFYGSGSGWGAIAEANKDKVFTPNFLDAGIILRLPSVNDILRYRRDRGI